MTKAGRVPTPKQAARRRKLAKIRYATDAKHRKKILKRCAKWRKDNRAGAHLFRCKITGSKRNARERGIKHTLTVAYIRDLMEKQGGLCAITGRKLEYQGPTLHIDAPSLDRLNRLKGYVPGNVRWVTFQANMALNVGSESDLIKFCEDVLRNFKEKAA